MATSKNKNLKNKTKLELVHSLSSAQSKNINSFKGKYDNDSNVDWKKTTKWTITTEGDKGLIILRYVKLSNVRRKIKERLDKKLYSADSKDKNKLEEICRILNYRIEVKIKAKEAWLVKSDFINVQGSELSNKFYDYMYSRSKNEKHSRACVRLVEMHFLNYFYFERKVPLFDYLEWHNLKIRKEYIEYLFNKKVSSNRMGATHLLSTKTIRAVIQYINHFFKFLHVESEGNIPDLKFSFPSITQQRFYIHENDRKKGLDKSKVVVASEEYIDEDTFDVILKNANEKIISAIWLSYKYGLRRSEVLALKPDNLKTNFLNIHEQVTHVTVEERNDDNTAKRRTSTTGLLKNKKGEGRKVPHWFGKKEDTYDYINSLQLMHPSVLTKEWRALMKELGMNYTFHNLRNAFCTNALREMGNLKISFSDVSLAMHHSDWRTTQKYLRDHRKLKEDELPWTPSMAG